MGYNFVHKHQMKEFFSGQVFVRIAYKQYLLEHLCKKVDKQIPEFSLRKLQHRLHGNFPNKKVLTCSGQHIVSRESVVREVLHEISHTHLPSQDTMNYYLSALAFLAKRHPKYF